MDIFRKPVEPKRKKQPPGRAPLWTQEFESEVMKLKPTSRPVQKIWGRAV